MDDLCGVYLIRSPSGASYVGGTKTSFRQRFTEHRTQLGRGVCTIPRLQEEADRVGVDNLEFLALKAFPPEEVGTREKEAIEFLKPTLNIAHARSKGSYERWPKLLIQGEELTVGQAARRYGLEPRTIRLRVERGLTGDDLIAQPHKASRKPYVRRR